MTFMSVVMMDIAGGVLLWHTLAGILTLGLLVLAVWFQRRRKNTDKSVKRASLVKKRVIKKKVIKRRPKSVPLNRPKSGPSAPGHQQGRLPNSAEEDDPSAPPLPSEGSEPSAPPLPSEDEHHVSIAVDDEEEYEEYEEYEEVEEEIEDEEAELRDHEELICEHANVPGYSRADIFAFGKCRECFLKWQTKREEIRKEERARVKEEEERRSRGGWFSRMINPRRRVQAEDSTQAGRVTRSGVTNSTRPTSRGDTRRFWKGKVAPAPPSRKVDLAGHSLFVRDSDGESDDEMSIVSDDSAWGPVKARSKQAEPAGLSLTVRDSDDDEDTDTDVDDGWGWR